MLIIKQSAGSGDARIVENDDLLREEGPAVERCYHGRAAFRRRWEGGMAIIFAFWQRGRASLVAKIEVKLHEGRSVGSERYADASSQDTR